MPDLKLWENIQRGWILPAWCRSGVEPPTNSETNTTNPHKFKQINRKSKKTHSLTNFYDTIKHPESEFFSGIQKERRTNKMRERANQ